MANSNDPKPTGKNEDAPEQNPDALEKAQEDAAEEREDEGGYQ